MGGWETILTFAALAVVFVVVLGIWRPTASEAATIGSYAELKSRDGTCKYKTQTSEVKLPDTDNDERADVCDICLGADNKQDRDADGLPDGCDKEPDDSSVVVCSVPIKNDKNKRCQATLVATK